MNLKDRFYSLASNYAENSEIDFLWSEIEKNYTQKKRAYHNLNHLEEIFHYYDLHYSKIKNKDEMAFAIFYHDIIYNIFKKDNEEKSAELAVNRLKKYDLSTSTISQLIIATKTHEGTTSDCKLMIDFDLAILGQSAEVYYSYSEMIRTEYQLIPHFIYKKGRIKVLEHFLKKTSIYKTSDFIHLYEKQARENIQRELHQLKK